MKTVGWLLDVYVNGEKAVLWLKSETGEAIRLIDQYTPDFYVEPKRVDPEELTRILAEHPNILHVIEENKFTSVNMKEKSLVLHVYVHYAKNFRRVIKDVEDLGLVKAYYNVDVLHVQRYLCQRGFAPTGKVEVEHDESGRLLCLHVLNDDLDIEPPPFTSLIFDIQIETQKFTPLVKKDPVSKILTLDEELSVEEIFEGREEETLSKFSYHIRTKDPDFLISTKASLRYLLERARIRRLNIQLGREEVNINKMRNLLPYAYKGRVHVYLQDFLRLGTAGILERSRFSLAPPGLSAKWPAGRTIDSRQCYMALKRGILPPKTRGFLKNVITAKDTIFRDRGGLILSPKVGLHENVVELDFESMFPQIIIKNNISYETVTPDSIDKSKNGFLVELTKRFLERRLYFKHLRKKFVKESKKWLWCEQRQLALKGILVCIYGYSGCFANRFNNVAAYEEINRIARETLVETMNIAMGKGFEVIYADTDSIFVKKKGASREDYGKLAENISKEVQLPIALDHHFKFLVLLTQEADPEFEATRRYFGKLINDKLYYRGVELRRHDCPEFLKRFQKGLMETLFESECAEEVERDQFKKAYDYVVKTCDEIREGKIELERLVVSKVLRKSVNKYRSMFPHVVAAMQMVQKGKRMRTGEMIDFIYVNASHTNPFRRVVPALLLDKRNYYDREKYVEMVLDVAETILGTFGFDRKQFGFQPKARNFREEIRREIGKEILSELRSLGDL